MLTSIFLERRREQTVLTTPADALGTRTLLFSREKIREVFFMKLWKFQKMFTSHQRKVFLQSVNLPLTKKWVKANGVLAKSSTMGGGVTKWWPRQRWFIGRRVFLCLHAIFWHFRCFSWVNGTGEGDILTVLAFECYNRGFFIGYYKYLNVLELNEWNDWNTL